MTITGSTLEALQNLEDGPFHRLCDALIRRWSQRYHDLQPHGINDREQSIKGQPDSFVGNTAADCSVGACYSTERGGGWARKAIRDVADARKACPLAEEFLVATPRDVSRDLEKERRKAWVSDLRAAAAPARVRVVGGRLLAMWLDRDHPDLRWELLRIPYSRLTRPALVQSANESSRRVLARLKQQERYAPATYSVRRADRELYDRWQTACDPDHHAERRATLVPVVSSAGMGKTSLVAHFVATFGGALPIVFLEARRFAFESEETLVRAVITDLQGVLAVEHRVQEEAALVHQLGEEHRLTVVVDAIDEAKAPPTSVAKAIEFWLESRLGRASVLIVTSRPDTWQLLGPERWRYAQVHGPQVDTNEWRNLDDTHKPRGRDDSLPPRFNANELADAWVRAGRALQDLYALPRYLREALAHPFTLRAYLKLTGSTPRPELSTQAAIVTAWLDERLALEADPAARIGPRELTSGLEWTAVMLEDRSRRWLRIEEFVGAPRFNPYDPPGPVIQRLLAASLLESHPDDPGLIGFAEEAVFDHFLATADAKDVARDAKNAVEHLRALPFTRARHRVERLSAIPGPAHEQFAQALNEADPHLAAVAVSAGPQQIPSRTRAAIAGALGAMLSAGHRVDACFAAELLGRMRCAEAEAVLLHWHDSNVERTAALRAYVAMAFLRLDSVAGARAVYEYPWLGQGGETSFYPDLFAMFRRASEPLRQGIGDLALPDLESADARTRTRALNLVGYLGDARVLPYLEARLDRDGVLDANENHVLFAIGDAAAALLDRSAHRTSEVMKPLKPGTTEWHQFYSRIVLLKWDLRYVVTTKLHDVVHGWLVSENVELRHMAYRVAESLRSVRLIHEAKRREPSWDDLPYQESYTWVDPDSWLRHWRATNDIAVRRSWLRFFTAAPTVEIEQVLIGCLTVPRLADLAARHLGRVAGQRARKPLRALLRSSADWWSRAEAVNALGRLRDAESIGDLVHVIADNSSAGDGSDQSHVRRCAAVALGLVQTTEAERVLAELLQDANTADAAAAGLLRHGSASAIAGVIGVARRRGADWLVARCADAYRFGGRWRRQYYTHVEADDLARFLLDHDGEFTEPKRRWEVLHALEALDGPGVRAFFRDVVRRRGTGSDVVLRTQDGYRASDVALRELCDRGDESVVGHFVREALEDHGHFWYVGDDLDEFSTTSVRRELAEALVTHAGDPKRLARVVRLLGAYGVPEDARLVEQYVAHPSPDVADAGREAVLYLTDPLRIPEGWSLLP